jgi:hypothetical protein
VPLIDCVVLSFGPVLNWLVVAWAKVARPVELGGLGVLDLYTMGYALRLCWEWLQRAQPDRIWAALPSKQEKIFSGHVQCFSHGSGRQWPACKVLVISMAARRLNRVCSSSVGRLGAEAHP